MKRVALFCACLWFSVPESFAQTPSPAPMTLTLSQAIELALTRSLDIQLAQLDLATFHSLYRQAIGAAIGDLKATANYERNFKKQAAFFSGGIPGTSSGPAKIIIGSDNSFAAGLTFEQPLFSGGKVSRGIDAGKKGIRGAEEAVRGARDDVILATKQYFFAYLLADSTVSIQNDNLKLANDHLVTIQKRYQQGLDSDLVVLRQKVEVANAQTTLIQAKNLQDLAITNFQKVLNLDVDRPLQLLGSLVPPSGELSSYETVAKTALKKNPELSVAHMRTLAMKDFYGIARAEHFPDIKGFVEYDWTAQSDDFSPGPNNRNDSLGAGVKLEWKLFTGGEIRERVAQARIEWNRAQEQEAKIEREIRVGVKQQWLAVIEARERARSQEAAVGQARRALESEEIRYKQGHASQLELNDATFALNRARTIYAQASHDFWVARAALEKAVGGPPEENR